MGTDSKNDDMTESCLPPPGTASGTTHVLQIANEHYVLRVWDRTADNGQHWVDYVALRTDTPDAYTRRGCTYVGPLTPPAEVERLRKIIAVGENNNRAAWTALALLREVIESLGPVGCMCSSEHVACAVAPTFDAEAQELIRGIQRICEKRDELLRAMDGIRAAANEPDSSYFHDHVWQAVRAALEPPHE